ncbi:hypothetical protein [Paludisphaera sp.]|uniref:hypothetical protein n=1 Tax=Paludisphaera sp. TaxID=2017432 RepID=UPI00301C8C38
MRRSIPIAVGVLVALAAGWSAGCSPSAPETAQIEGKTPAEYRDELEKKGGVLADGKARKARGKGSRAMRD